MKKTIGDAIFGFVVGFPIALVVNYFLLGNPHWPATLFGSVVGSFGYAFWAHYREDF